VAETSFGAQPRRLVTKLMQRRSLPLDFLEGVGDNAPLFNCMGITNRVASSMSYALPARFLSITGSGGTQCAARFKAFLRFRLREGDHRSNEEWIQNGTQSRRQGRQHKSRFN
jgi:hypothetical protein